MYRRAITFFCSLLWISALTCVRLAYVLWLWCSRLMVATFTSAPILRPYTKRSADDSHHSTINTAPTASHGHRSSTLSAMSDTTGPNSSRQDSPFLALAEELTLSITSHIPRKDLCSLARVSKKCHRLVTPLIWKHIELKDCRANTDFATGNRVVTYGPATASHRGRNIPAGTQLGSDEHDDMPLIKILLVLAT